MKLGGSVWQKIPPVLRTSLLILCGLLLLVCLSVLMIPTLDGPHSRQFANEASAVSKLRTILTLQNQYTIASAYSGFACELAQLRPLGQQRFPDSSLEFLATGVQSGYRFSLVSCGPDANRARARYQVTAVPLQHGTTGFRAFCADETGVIWYDPEGSAANCLASQHALE